MLKISIIIATYNRSESLKKTLDSLLLQDIPADLDYECVIVDNNSTDQTRQTCEAYIHKFHQRLKYLFEPKQGKPFALNTGIKEAKGQIIAFTDDDVTFDLNWLKIIANNFNDESVDVVTGRILPAGEILTAPWYTDKLSSVLVKIDYSSERIGTTQVTGANMAFRRKVFEAIGDFDFRPGLINEDTFLSKKLVRYDFKIVYDPAMLVYHHFNPSRFTKTYFRKWYWLSGKALAEINKEDDAILPKLILAVPFWRYREVLDSIKGIFMNIFDAPERFYHELWLRRRVGYCWQRWTTLKEKTHA